MEPFDIQVNGYAGVDFCSLNLTGEQFHHACKALRGDGVSQFLATVITDTVEHLEAKLANMVKLREADPLVKEMVAGFHIEGPFMSAVAGFAGAHPQEAMRPGNVEDARRLLDACDGLARLVTVAPECDQGYRTIQFLVDQGVCVSAGHCNPSLEQLRGAIDHGLSMVTHFGNGCPVTLPRHDNVLQRFLHFREDLWFCFIPDGAHVEFFALKNYLDFVGVDRSIMVTDAIGAAKMPAGIYELSGITIEVDKNGVARRPGSPNLAGSTVTMPQVIENLRDHLDLSANEIRQLIDLNPRAALGI
jgi:N-acetylglucosamine-6-phosphate deacetylase